MTVLLQGSEMVLGGLGVHNINSVRTFLVLRSNNNSHW